VLDSDTLSVERMPRIRDIAGREHIRCGCLKLLVDDDPVVDLDPGVAGEVDAGRDANPDDDEVAVDRLAAVRPYTRH
jgi:hypothetical protein